MNQNTFKNTYHENKYKNVYDIYYKEIVKLK